jgi:OHCU decarboxylase
MMLMPTPTGLDRNEFIEAYGSIYEHSPWVAEAVFETRVDHAEGLAQQMQTAVDQASRELKLKLLRAHPELVGKLELSALTEESQSEQRGAGLTECSAEEYQAFRQLNDQYNEKFGFPFIFAVKGFHRIEILDSFRQRVDNDIETEFETAITQVHRIGRLRLEAMEQPND